MESIPIICEVMKCFAAPVGKRINYVRNLSKNTKELKEEADYLYARRDDVKQEIERLKMEKAPTEQCQKWLQAVDQIEQHLRKTEDEYQAAAATKRCGIFWCCNVYSRRKLGESVEEMRLKIQGLKDYNFGGHFLADLKPQRLAMVPNLSLKAETLVEVTLKKLISFLGDKKTQKIGIWGKGGIGKTTIMQALNNMPEVRGMFDLIIWTTVSNSWDIKKLQKEICDRLSLDIRDKFEDNVAITLLERLQGQKYLLLLDDVWKTVNLVKIGLPNTSKDNGCKVVLTTREMQVCREMETDAEIELLPWPENEAWDMFCSKVGGVAMSPDIRRVAEGVVKECAGLPLALNVVAGMLRKEEDERVWSDILRELKSPTASKNKSMDEKVYEILKMSYDHIKDDEVRNCFLFCGLYPEDWKIKKSKLIKYWHSEGLLLTNDETLADSCNKGHRVIRDLADKSLLERCKDEGFVKLHDLVRDMVLRMTSSLLGGKECKHFVRDKHSNSGALHFEEWETAKRISLVGVEVNDFPRNPSFSTLTTLIIQRNLQLHLIPEDLFVDMPCLRILDLSRSKIKRLPASVGNLVNLRSLLLRYCACLESLPKEVNAMKKLEMLLATKTKMRQVPLEIFELKSLKILKLTLLSPFDDSLGSLMSGGVKWRVESLEVFRISSSLCQSMSDEDIRVIAAGLGKLRALRSLEFDFRALDGLEDFMRGSIPWRDQTLTKLEISVNCNRPCVYRREWRNRLAYDAVAGGEEEGSSSSNMMLPDCISEVLGLCGSFRLENHGGAKFLSTLFSGLENFGRGLKSCQAMGCWAMEKVIENETDDDDEIFFPNLEILYLINLENLRSIWDPPKPQNNLIGGTSTFSNLKDLLVSDCKRLKKLFSWRFIGHLPNLKELCIKNCAEIREMISDDDDNEEAKSEIVAAAAALPKLKELILLDLPEFVSFCSTTTTAKASSSSSLRWPSLKILEVYGCPKLKRLLPLGVGNVVVDDDYAHNLIDIDCDSSWWEALEWDHHDDNAAAVKLRLQPHVNTTHYLVLDAASMFASFPVSSPATEGYYRIPL